MLIEKPEIELYLCYGTFVQREKWGRLASPGEKPNTVACLVLSYVIELILIWYLNLTCVINNALDLNISIFIFFQVLEGLKKVTLISPADVSFAEARRDALIAIAKYVSFCLILILSLEAFSCSFCFLLWACSMILEIRLHYDVHF